MFALQYLALRTAAGQRLDQLTMSAMGAQSGPLVDLSRTLLDATMPVVFCLLVIAFAIAVIRRDGRALTQGAVVVVGANVTTQLLKHVVIDRPALADGVFFTGNSFPSGHATLSAATACVILLVVHGARGGGAAAIGGAMWALVVGWGTIASVWHRPSDVLGGLLVVAAWLFATRAVWTAPYPPTGNQ